MARLTELAKALAAGAAGLVRDTLSQGIIGQAAIKVLRTLFPSLTRADASEIYGIGKATFGQQQKRQPYEPPEVTGGGPTGSQPPAVARYRYTGYITGTSNVDGTSKRLGTVIDSDRPLGATELHEAMLDALSDIFERYGVGENHGSGHVGATFSFFVQSSTIV